MEDNTQTVKRERATKFLAVIGFISVVILLAWAAFTAVGYIPDLLSAVGQSEEEQEDRITFTTTPALAEIAAGDTVTLEWEEVDERGSYAVRYDCREGVSAVVRTEAYGTQSIDCDRFYNVGSITSVMMTLESDDSESVTVPYTIAFIPDSEPDTQYEAHSEVRLTGDQLAQTPEPEEEAPTEPIEEEDTTEPEPTEEEEVTEPEPEDDTSVTTPAPRPETRYEYRYTIPQSDPSGYTDLGISLSSLGRYDNGTFRPRGTLSTDTRGAIRFTVKNNGTRTSETWSYTATLPGGRTYESGPQDPLRPNERTTLTLGFRSPATTGQYDFRVEIDTSRDRDRNNHQLNWGLRVE